jgi:4-hydroxy-tetrahydrodipicolinate synthase
MGNRQQATDRKEKTMSTITDTSIFRGSIVALVTPFKKTGEVDEEKLRELVNWHIEEGTDAIVPCGTTGESVTMTHQEQERVIRIVIEEARGRIPVIAGAGTNNTAASIEMSKRAKAMGAQGVLIVCPYYNKPTQEGIARHYKAIAQEVQIPVIVYNVPSRTGTNITAETLLRLTQEPYIVAVKEASGNIVQMMQILKDRPSHFRVLAGDDVFAYPLIALGGDGCISVVANETPRLFSQMIHLCLDKKFDEALKIHNQLFSLMNLNFIETNPIPVKTALEMMGKMKAYFRLPLCEMGEANKEKLRIGLKELNLI